jgi:CHAD domain-containing protein
MPVDPQRSRLAFQKLNRHLLKLTTKAAPQSVHKFRTYSRRVETLVGELAPEQSRNDKRLLKLLSRLRKKAGRVRDLDVQIGSLRGLKISQEPRRKSQLLRHLSEDRAKKEKKLAANFDKKTVRELRKRLKRASSELEIPQGTEPLSLALRQVDALGRDDAPLTEKVLHQYRIAGKRARYIAELAGDTPQARSVVEQLKHMQDVIGDWHDSLKLTERAEELFGGVLDSGLVAALRNVTRAKFHQAFEVLINTRAALSGKKPVAIAAPAGRKSSARAARTRPVAA